MDTDFQIVDNLLKINHDHDLPAFSSSQWLHFPDRNQGSYASEIVIDAESSLNSWVVWSESYIVVPFTVQSSTATAYTSAAINSLAFKDGGAVNLISGVQVGNQDSTFFSCNTGGTWYRNQIRLAMEHGAEWEESLGPDAGYYPQTEEYSGADAVAALASPGASYGLNIQPFAGAASADITVGATISTSIRNPLYNESFEKANRWLQNQLTWLGNGVFGGSVMIPFTHVHPMFHCLDFPMKGFWLKMLLYTNNFSTYMPMVAANGLPAPKISIGNNQLGLTACQIYYKAVQANNGLKQKLDAKLRAGFDRDLQFCLCDFFGQGAYSNNALQVTQVTNASVVAPQRLWTLCPPAGAASSAVQYSAIQTAATLTNVNVLVGDRQYFSNPLQYSDQFWAQVKEAMASSGVSDAKASSVSFQSWKNSRRFYPLTLARLEDDRSVTTPVTVQFQATRRDTTSGPGGTLPGSIDWIWLTDRLWNIRLHCSETGVKLVSSSATPPK